MILVTNTIIIITLAMHKDLRSQAAKTNLGPTRGQSGVQQASDKAEEPQK